MEAHLNKVCRRVSACRLQKIISHQRLKLLQQTQTFVLRGQWCGTERTKKGSLRGETSVPPVVYLFVPPQQLQTSVDQLTDNWSGCLSPSCGSAVVKRPANYTSSRSAVNAAAFHSLVRFLYAR